MLEHPEVKDDATFHDSWTQLIVILQKVGIENCYVHHPALLVTALENYEFPIQMCQQVVKSWLSKDFDTYELVPTTCRDIFINCLLVSNCR